MERLRRLLNGRLGMVLMWAALYSAVAVFPRDGELWLRAVIVLAVAGIGWWVSRQERADRPGR